MPKNKILTVLAVTFCVLFAAGYKVGSDAAHRDNARDAAAQPQPQTP